MSQRPSTPILSPAPVSSTLASYPSKAPPLPSRPKNPGSTHTSYVPPTRPESVTIGSPSGFREPELIEDAAEEEDPVPDLIPQTEVNWPYDIGQDTTNTWQSWQTTTTMADWERPPGTHWADKTLDDNAAPDYAMDYVGSSRIDDFTIDGRSRYEESNWWNPEERERNKRPGPGILPPVLAEDLHDPHHSLFSVNVTAPSGVPLSQHAASGSTSKDHSSAGPSSTPTHHSHHASSETFSPPSEDEVRMSVPHPNAYYCPKDNGWVVLCWKSSSVPPPLSKTYLNKPPLPDQSRRRQTVSCTEETDQSFGKKNKTHHFHIYEKAVDSHKLTPPFRQDEWASLENVKQKRRAGAIMNADLDINAINAEDVDLLNEKEAESDEEGKLLDLYICCQCSLYCVASGVLPGVIPKKYLDELVRDKRGHPSIGKNAEQTIALALETFLT